MSLLCLSLFFFVQFDFRFSDEVEELYTPLNCFAYRSENHPELEEFKPVDLEPDDPDRDAELTVKLNKTRTSRSFKVSNWVILEFKSQFEIRTFIYLNTLDYGTLINKEIKESISNNFDVLCWNSPRCFPWGSPDGWIRFLFYKTCRWISFNLT